MLGKDFVVIIQINKILFTFVLLKQVVFIQLLLSEVFLRNFVLVSWRATEQTIKKYRLIC